jgi:hypothetical protein
MENKVVNYNNKVVNSALSEQVIMNKKLQDQLLLSSGD